MYTFPFYIGFAYNFVIALHFTSNALYPLYVVHEQGGAATVGLFMGIYSIAAVSGRPMVAAFIDRYGPRAILIAGSLMLSLPAFGYIGLLGAGIGWPSLALRTIQGLGYGAHFSATFTLAASLAPPARRNEAVAMYGVSGLLGAMTGPYLAERLVIANGLPAFFIGMGCVGVLAAGIIVFVPSATRVAMSFPKPMLVLRAFRASGMMRPLALAFLFAISFSSPTTFLATFAAQRGIADFSLYFTLWGISGVLVRFLGGKWGDRVGQRRVLIPGFALYAAGLAVIHFSGSTTALAFAGILSGCAHGMSFPAVTSMAHALAPPEYSGSAMALATGMMDLASAVNAFLIGPLAGVYGYGIVFPLASASSIAACALLITGPDHRGRHPV